MNTFFKPVSLIPLTAMTIKSPTNDGNLLSNFGNMISDIKKSDKKISNAITGRVDLHELVTDISLAETNLKILVAVRDSLMNAIHELTRMQM